VRASLCARLVVVHALSTVLKLVTLLLQLAVAVASGGAGPPAAGGAPRALEHGRVRQARCACQSCLQWCKRQQRIPAEDEAAKGRTLPAMAAAIAPTAAVTRQVRV